MNDHIYLAHHGIKGMRWGVRRFRNDDGTLTEAGKKRYSVKETFTKIKEAPERHRESLEKKYRDQGLTEEDAALAAKRRQTAERVLVSVGAVAVTAAVAYVAYKHWDNTADKYIKEGGTLARIASDTSPGLHEGAYVAYKKSDVNEQYLGLYGKQKFDRGQAVFQKVMTADKRVKIASRESGRKVLDQMVKTDSDYRRDLKQYLNFKRSRMAPFNSSEAQRNALEKAVKALDRGRVTPDVYDAVNLQLVDHKSPVVNRFRQAMKKAGYDAIEDMNDKRLSGFNAKSPLILLNVNAVKTSNVRQVGEKEIRKAYNAFRDSAIRKTNRTTMTTLGATALASIGLGTFSKMQSQQTDNKIVADYRAEHPNSNLSYDEILQNYWSSPIF